MEEEQEMQEESLLLAVELDVDFVAIALQEEQLQVKIEKKSHHGLVLALQKTEKKIVQTLKLLEKK